MHRRRVDMKILAVALLSLVIAGGAAGAAPPTAVNVAMNVALNQNILVDARGMTLYMYEGDYKTVSGCNASDGCLKAWPALLSKKAPKAGAGVNAKLLKTVKQHDGRVQVAYAGHLLYTWAGYPGQPPADKPGDVNGMGIIGAWWPLTPAGVPIKTKP